MNDSPINRTTLIIEWQQRALAYYRLGDDMGKPPAHRRLHRESARIYAKCADELLSLVKNKDEKEEEGG